MKIINRNEGKDIKCKCLRCHSDLEINTFDLTIGWINVFFRCPVCNNKICVPDNQLYLFGLRRGYEEDEDDDYDWWDD